jgi:hypothetical protein
MPSPLSVVQRLDAVTGPFAYVRLLGDREAVDAPTPTLDHIVIDRSGQVADDAQAIRTRTVNDVLRRAAWPEPAVSRVQRPRGTSAPGESLGRAPRGGDQEGARETRLKKV